ncbi:MAG TPA: LysM peptidoglycan-binding domain-containing M23 family metallopeptidase [Rickettsiales bacterium]|nr:LysM peptidoglycan-binding domain-containing M23 family metallopeptidase [Rickettsiales bacterium]
MKNYYTLFLGLVFVSCTQNAVEVVNKENMVFKPNYSETYVESPDGKIARSLRGRNDSDKAQEISIINKQDSDYGFYVVKSGDNLSSIASKYNTSTEEIAELNGLKKPYPIRVGQKLKISGLSNKNETTKESLAEDGVYIVKSGDNLLSIAKKYDTSIEELAKLNDLEKPYPVRIGQKLKVSKIEMTTKNKQSGTYVVKAGDNLSSIASKNDMTLAEIIDLNDLKNPYSIRVGQKLKISKNVVVVKDSNNNTKKIIERKETKLNSDDSFMWPIQGNILSGFGNKGNGLYNDGINIGSSSGSEFRATKDGVVAYVGNELRGYGTIILIKHDSNWISAYAHCGSVKVARGDRVKKGQVIGTVGQTGNVDKPQLYFSLRNGREAVDPLKYLKNS